MIDVVRLTAIAVSQGDMGEQAAVVMRYVIAGDPDGRWYRDLIPGNIFRTALSLFRLGTPENVTAGFMRLEMDRRPSDGHWLASLQGGRVIDLGSHEQIGGAAYDLQAMLRNTRVNARIDDAIIRNLTTTFDNPAL